MARDVNIRKLLKAIADARETAPPPRLLVVGAGGAAERVASLLTVGAQGEGAALVEVCAAADFPGRAAAAGGGEVVVLVADGLAPAAALPVVSVARQRGSRVVAAVEGVDGAAWARAAGLRGGDLAWGMGPSGRRPTLEERVVRAAGDGAVALAAALPALRRACAERLIWLAALQNAAIGAIVIIPGADMPAMTANQVRMVLRIAQAYGEEPSADRAVEILSVVAGGFVLRGLARQALEFVPGVGWLLKGAVGFSGTVAIGEAAIAYFEAGAPLRVSRVQRIERQLERIQSRLPGPLRRLAAG